MSVYTIFPSPWCVPVDLYTILGLPWCVSVYTILAYLGVCHYIQFYLFRGKPIVAVEDYLVPGESTSICRRDVARFMLDIAVKGDWKKTCVAITSKRD